jgi:hypothetical protein
MKYSYLFVLVGALTLAGCDRGPDDEFGREVTDPRIDTTDRTQTGASGTQTQRTQPQSQPPVQQPGTQQQPGGFDQPRDAGQTGTTSNAPSSSVGVDPIDRNTDASTQQTEPQRETLPPQ